MNSTELFHLCMSSAELFLSVPSVPSHRQDLRWSKNEVVLIAAGRAQGRWSERPSKNVEEHMHFVN